MRSARRRARPERAPHVSRAARFNARGFGPLRGRPLTVNASAEARLSEALVHAVAEMSREVTHALADLHRDHQPAVALDALAPPKAAGVILRNDQGRVLILRRSASAPDFPGNWCFPGGGIEDGETAEAAALRELQEETELAPDGPLAWFDDDGVFRAFTATITGFPTPRLDHEHSGWAWVAPQELRGVRLDPYRDVHPGTARMCAALASATAQDAEEEEAEGLAGRVSKLLQAMLGRFEVVFETLAPDLARRWANDIDRASAAQLKGSLREISRGLTVNAAATVEGVQDAVQASIASNVGLIKSIPAQYFQRIEGTVYRSVQQGRGLADVFADVENIGAVTRSRALLIARDQTSKATTAINVARMKANRIRKFEWLHSAGGREPREYHLHVLNGRIFEIANPPVIDQHTGERGFPGQLINCRCRMFPVIEYGGDDEREDEGS